MTTLAMIFGMLPLAFAIGAGAEMRAPMARAVIGGLITSTLLSLLVVPVVYTFLDDFRPSILWSWMGWFRRSPAVPEQRPGVRSGTARVGELSALPSLPSVPRLVSYGYAMKFVVAIGLGLLLFAAPSYAQLQQGTIVGSLVGPSGASIGEAQVTLFDQLGNAVTTVTASNGQFRLTNVAIGSYSLRAEAAPFEAVVQSLTVVDALPITLELKLSAALAEQVNVTAETNQPVTTATRTTLAGDAVRRAPIRISSRGLQDAIATTPGWATEDNGLMHARGVDDGFLYVVDGMPLYERMDSAHGIAPDPEMVESINVLVGHVPPEFGFKSGGVIEVRTSSRKSDSWLGNLQTSTGSDATHQGSAVVGGPMSRSTALTFGFSGQSSDRFLDPVHPDNLHNSGNAANGTAEFSWLLSPASTLSIVGGVGRTSFEVPHNEDQEAAGQDQHQTNLQTWQTASWQRAWSGDTVSQIAAYHRSGSAALLGTELDTPLYLDANRTLRRVGVLGSVTHHRGRHVLKAGVEAARLSLREDFSFFVTDEDAGEDADLSEGVLEHDEDNPFVFAGRENPTLFAAYAQDSVQFGRGLTVDVGVRVDRARMLIESSQWSPRLGVAYHLPGSGTTVRGSADRFYQPPQAENLLLGSSEEARELSPFVDETGGGEDLEPERQWATELGINQSLPRGVRLDVSYWRRRVDDVSDPNVLFGTTLIVPNAIARGEADGVDVRLDFPRRRGVSGYVSYTNAHRDQFRAGDGRAFFRRRSD